MWINVPQKVLPFQRHFNFINGERSIGKTYSVLKYCLKKAIEKENNQFIYIVRTQEEKKKGALNKAFAKVWAKEFKDYEFDFDIDMCFLKTDKKKSKVLGHCIALSEAVKIKKEAFPFVRYMIMDEYMLEDSQSTAYVNGWKEPDLLLSIYHTVDREEDRVICFLLGNNTKFYNPYHMHPAFHIPKINKGEIWTSENVLFWWAVSDDELNEARKGNKFLNMIEGTEYGTYARKGEYADDNNTFIGKRSEKARHVFNIKYLDEYYGVWLDYADGFIYLDKAIDPSCKFNYALTKDDHSENTLLTKGKTCYYITWLSKNYKLGNVKYANAEIRAKLEKGIYLIL